MKHNRLWKRQHRQFDKGKRKSMYLATTSMFGTPSYVGTTAANRAARRQEKRNQQAFERSKKLQSKVDVPDKRVHRNQSR